MDLILHLQNLSPVATSRDVRHFFMGLDIPDGGVQIVGGEDGDAFINVHSEQDLLRALSFDNEPLLGQCVKLFLAKEIDVQQVIEKRNRELDRAKASLTGCAKDIESVHDPVQPPDSFRTYSDDQDCPIGSPRSYADDQDRPSRSHRSYADDHDQPSISARSYAHDHDQPSSSHMSYADDHDTPSNSPRRYAHDRYRSSSSPQSYAGEHKRSSSSHRSYGDKHDQPSSSRRGHADEDDSFNVRDQPSGTHRVYPGEDGRSQDQDLSSSSYKGHTEENMRYPDKDSPTHHSPSGDFSLDTSNPFVQAIIQLLENKSSSSPPSRETFGPDLTSHNKSGHSSFTKSSSEKPSGDHNSDAHHSSHTDKKLKQKEEEPEIDMSVPFYALVAQSNLKKKQENAETKKQKLTPTKSADVPPWIKQARSDGLDIVNTGDRDDRHTGDVRSRDKDNSPQGRPYSHERDSTNRNSTKDRQDRREKDSLRDTRSSQDHTKSRDREDTSKHKNQKSGDKSVRSSSSKEREKRSREREREKNKRAKRSSSRSREDSPRDKSRKISDSRDRESTEGKRISAERDKTSSRRSSREKDSSRGKHDSRDSNRSRHQEDISRDKDKRSGDKGVRSSSSPKKEREKRREREREKHRSREKRSSSSSSDDSPRDKNRKIFDKLSAKTRRSSRERESDSVRQYHRVERKDSTLESIGLYHLDVTVTATDIRKFLRSWEVPDGGIILRTDRFNPNAIKAYVTYYPKGNVEVKSLAGTFLNGRPVEIKSIPMELFEREKISDQMIEETPPPAATTGHPNNPMPHPGMYRGPMWMPQMPMPVYAPRPGMMGPWRGMPPPRMIPPPRMMPPQMMGPPQKMPPPFPRPSFSGQLSGQRQLTSVNIELTNEQTGKAPSQEMGPPPKISPQSSQLSSPGHESAQIPGHQDVAIPPSMNTLHYIQLNPSVLPPDCTASEVWSWFGGPDGVAKHAILVTTTQHVAVVAYVGFLHEHQRDETIALRKEIAPLARTHAGVNQALSSMGKNMAILQSTESGVDTDITGKVCKLKPRPPMVPEQKGQRQLTSVNTESMKGPESKGTKLSQEMGLPLGNPPLSSQSPSPGYASAQGLQSPAPRPSNMALHYMQINPPVLTPDCTASEVWSWFGGPDGVTKHAILVTTRQHVAVVAYVGFFNEFQCNEDIARRKELLGVPRTHSGVFQALSPMKKTMLILESTESGVDKLMSNKTFKQNIFLGRGLVVLS